MNEADTDPTRDSVVSFREITADTVRAICKLAVTEEQNKFVAPNSISIAQAYFEKKAWLRAIYADDTPVGFVMLYDDTEKPEYFLWRFMMDTRYQGMGFGRQATALLVEHVKTRPNATVLMTSVVQKPGGPQEFYQKQGFVLTGEYEEGEALLRYDLAGGAG